MTEGAIPVILRALGAREIAHGIGIFARPRSVWTRLVGRRHRRRVRRIEVPRSLQRPHAAVGGRRCAPRGRCARSARDRPCGCATEFGEPITAAMTINKPRRGLRVLARLLAAAAVHALSRVGRPCSTSVARTGSPRRRSASIEWDAEITERRPGPLDRVALDVTKGIPMRGRVTFSQAPAGRGTEVASRCRLAPLREACSRSPRAAIGDLRRFKQVIETGEVVRLRRVAAVRGLARRAARIAAKEVVPMRANCWMGKQRRPRRERARSEDPQRSATRSCRITVDGDLRLRPAPLQRLHADDGEGRHPRPRVHGRGRRGRPRRQEPQGRRPRRRAVPDRVRRTAARASAQLFSLLRELEPERVDRREADGPLAVRASSATRT